MKVNTESICLECKHFWHECYVMVGDDCQCMEWCKSNSVDNREMFYEEDEITRCSGFEKE
ncbi:MULTISPECIES: hypothetical protein [Paenibacillus]|uniref:hypothetical protein n=1 Tax=Paenibacillus TaxID=44249 RepID=UPI000B843D31|nr:hypothetical protein [Paenibacillus amylolyticus]